jgi:tetratricopeptide (TPR) repeat protein
MLFLPFFSLWGRRIAIPILPPDSSFQLQKAADSELERKPALLPQGADRGIAVPASGLTAAAYSSKPAAAGQMPAFSLKTYQWAGILYLAGFSILIGRLLLGMLLSRRLTRNSQWDERGFYLSRCAIPLSTGWLQSRILLPAESKHWDAEKLAAVLAHEREHVLRRDPLVEWLALLNRGIYWFHPVAWWLRRKLSTLAEQACDEAVLSSGCDRIVYAELLLELARSVKRRGILIANWGSSLHGSPLQQRIRRIAMFSQNLKVSRFRLISVIALSAAVIIAASACSITSVQSYSSTPHNAAANLVSKGMAAEENLSTLDTAIKFYRQVISVPTDQRMYAAYAQFRLAQIFLKKGELSAAGREFTKLAQDFPDCSDLVSTLAAESPTDIFNSPPFRWPSVHPMSSIRNGRYHHNLTGFEINLMNWAVESESSVSSGGGEIVFLSNPGLKAKISVWVKPDRLASADIPSRLRGAIPQKVLQRLSFQDYKVRANSIQPLSIGGNQAIQASADFVEQGNVMIEYLTWIYTEKTRVFFFARFKASEFQNLKDPIDQLIATSMVP